MSWTRYFRRSRWHDERAREIQAYLDIETDANLARGMSLEGALHAAYKKFGNPVQIREEIYHMNTIAFIESTWNDLRYGVRMLRFNPGFATVAILSLALGIGANAAIFQLLDAVRLRSLPVQHPEQLAEVRVPNGTEGHFINNGYAAQLTTPLWDQVRKLQQPFSGTFATSDDRFAIGEGAQVEQHDAIWVSGDYFNVLGVPPVRGRLLQADDDKPGCPNSTVISYRYWQSHFGGRDSALGARLIIDDQPFNVIGVAPASFYGIEVGRAFDVAIPICASTALGGRGHDRRDVFWLTVMGRLKPGWTLDKATAQLSAISPGIFEATVPQGYSSDHVHVYRSFRLAAFRAGEGISRLREEYKSSLLLLLGITGLVLLIACANLANLMLARAASREREIAVRLALGASRWRLVRQLLSESGLLALAGALVGGVVAVLGSRALIWFLSTKNNAPQLDLSIDWRVLSFMALVAASTCVVFGLLPALRASNAQPGAAIKAGGRGMTAGRERFSFQRVLVVAQISICLVLLVGAVLFTRSFRNLLTFNPGFREDHVIAAGLGFYKMRLPPERLKPFQQQLLDEVRATPGIADAASTTNIPLWGGSWTLGTQVGARRGSSKFTWVSPGYFRTMDIRLIAGRDLNSQDTENSQRVVLVNETFARTYLAGLRPVGTIVRTIAEPGYPETACVIVGVVADTRYSDLRGAVPPISFAPAAQNPISGPWTSLMIRSSIPPAAAIAALKQNLDRMHPQLNPSFFEIYQQTIREGLLRERMMAAVSGFFGGLAAILASIGLYGVISYIVARRKNEIGIRMALGAGRGRVIGMILRESGLVLAIGLVIGSALSLVAARSAGTLLFELKAYDPVTLVASATLLAVICLLATYLPARRASRLNPMTTLREE